MLVNKRNIIQIFIVLINTTISHGGISDYLESVRSYFSVQQEETALEGFDNKIPYEVSLQDTKFLENAIKLTGVAVSELDSCQHRVVLKLQSDCHNMNDEMVSKMAVHLLNCQSYVEGRPMYPCTEQMSIKECTINMDGNTWNSYHLMNNRVRAVCFTVRQSQFRGLTEHTVNRLMDAARNQIDTLGKIAEDQEHLQYIAQNTLNAVSEGHKELSEQQKDLHRAQLFGQMQVEDNINKLAQEKQLILESQAQLDELTRNVQEKLDNAAHKIENQSKETETNHRELQEDLIKIQKHAQSIFKRLEDTSNMLIKQTELANRQYAATFKQLAEVNATVHSLVTLVDRTKTALEDRLAWITTSLGGTDEAIERLYFTLWHVAFLLVGMIACAFVGARTSTRLAVIFIIPANLLLSIYEFEQAVDALTLAATLAVFITVQTLFFGLATIVRSQKAKEALPWIKQKLTPQRNPSPTHSQHSNHSNNNSVHSDFNHSEYDDNVEISSSYHRQRYVKANVVDYASPTPPLSRNGFTRSRSRTPLSLRNDCAANTRQGTPCKLGALPGREFCYRHQKGDSVIG